MDQRGQYDKPTFIDDPIAHDAVMQSQRWRILRSYLNKLNRRGGQLIWPISRDDVRKTDKPGDKLYLEARLAQAAGYNWAKSVHLQKYGKRISSKLVFYDENNVDVDPTLASKAIIIFELPPIVLISEDTALVGEITENVNVDNRELVAD